MNTKANAGAGFKNILARFMLIFILIAVFAILAFMRPESFPTLSNIMVFLKEGCIYCTVILGVTWVFSANELDVSFGDVAAFTCVLTAVLNNAGIPVDLSALLAIICGLVFGLINGLLVTRTKLNSLIVTIATSGIAKATALILGKGTNVSIVKNEGSFFYQLVQGNVSIIPAIFVFIVVIVAVMSIIQEKTKFGQYIYAIGDNKEAAHVAGINNARVLMIVYLIAAFFSSLGGVLMMFKVSSGQPQLGSSLFLNSYTKLFLGALLFKLGKTNIIGTFIGSVLMAMLVNGLTQLGTSSYISQIITGILLVVGVSITSVLQRRRQNAMQIS